MARSFWLLHSVGSRGGLVAETLTHSSECIFDTEIERHHELDDREEARFDGSATLDRAQRRDGNTSLLSKGLLAEMQL